MSMPSRVVAEPVPSERTHLRLVEQPPSPDVSIRTCANCGEHTAFIRDHADPSWFLCSACGEYA